MTDKAYTPAEASAVLRLPLKAVHKVLDSRLIRPQRSRQGNHIQRLLSTKQLVYLRLEAEGVGLLPVATRREVAREIEAAPNVDIIAVPGGSALFIQVKNARKDVQRELKRLRNAQRMAISDPDIMGGTPVYRGTQVPVDMMAAMLARGASTQEILEAHPSLIEQQVELAPLYAAAFPRRGRPARCPWAKQKPLHVAS